jgi:hypothetical protein
MHDFLGIDIQILIEERKDVLIEDNSTPNGRILRIADILFQTPDNQWLTRDSLPKQPLSVWDTTSISHDVPLISSRLPVIYGCEVEQTGSTKNYLIQNQDELYLGLDIFGSAFFMLTRYEEIAKPDRDEHDRFPAKASLACQEGFVERPIVNEYLEILWAFLQKLWPGLTRKKREYRLCLSHDVDEIFSVVGKPLKQVIRRIGGDTIVRRDPILALRSMQAAWRGGAEKDPCNTFDFIMDVSEKNGVTSTFNFMTGLGHTEYDQRYSIDHPWVRHCLRRIVQRGHLIGFHPTYGSYLNAEITKTEFQRLTKAAGVEGAEQNEWGGRQHYLRWQNPATWQHWEDAGLNYDSTVGFADLIGFRTGCCYEYPVFNLKERKKLNLRERSLIVMDGVVLDGNGTFKSKFRGKMSLLNHTCCKFDGDFTLLWHNEHAMSRQQRKSYISTLASLL